MNNYPEYHASIIVTKEVENELGKILSRYPKDKLFLITENNCDLYCCTSISKTPGFEYLKKVVIPAGEESKKLSFVFSSLLTTVLVRLFNRF